MEIATAKQIRLHLEVSFMESCDLADMGSLFGYSPSVITRGFRTHFGMTPRQFIENLRYAEAKRLLLDTSESIESICSTVGYQSPATFCRRFKALQGLTPTQHRAKQLELEKIIYIPGCFKRGATGFRNSGQ